MAIPGSVVAAGKLVTPGGAQGPSGGVGPPGPNAVSTDSGNIAILGSDSKIYVPDPTPVITSVRLRSHNSVGNPNFEVDQRNIHTAINNPQWICDRWVLQKAGTMAVATQAISQQPVPLPGTSFNISQGKMNIHLTTQQASLGASDYLFVMQYVEGPQWRELSGDVTSISLLVYSDVALKFSVFIRSPDVSRSLCKLCTVPAGVWTVVTLPNIPVPTSGNFTTAIGSFGYNIGICLAVGTTFIAPANDIWQNGNFMGAIGMDNWGSKPVNTNFTVTMVQHEPGPLCTTFIDKPFTQNLDECLRYFQKSYDYGTALAAVTVNGAWSCSTVAGSHPINPLPFQKRMAKVPSFNMRSTATGAFNAIRDSNAAVDRSVTGTVNLGESGCGGVTIGSTNASATYCYGHYTADTGW